MANNDLVVSTETGGLGNRLKSWVSSMRLARRRARPLAGHEEHAGRVRRAVRQRLRRRRRAAGRGGLRLVAPRDPTARRAASAGWVLRRWVPARIRSCAASAKRGGALTGERTDRYRFMVFPKQHSRRSTRADARHIDLEYERIPQLLPRGCTASCSGGSPCGRRSPRCRSDGRRPISTTTSSACKCEPGETMLAGTASITCRRCVGSRGCSIRRRARRFLVVSDSDDVAPMLASATARGASSAIRAATPRADSWLTPRGIMDDLIDMLLLGADAALVRELLEHVQRGRVVARRHDGARERLLSGRQPARAGFELARYQS